ncbi:hypothetical protein V8C86DRAFT_3141849 [Haematococcus lacustris]
MWAHFTICQPPARYTFPGSSSSSSSGALPSADTALPLLQCPARASYQGTEPPPAAPPRQSLTASCLLDPAPPSCPPSLAAGKGASSAGAGQGSAGQNATSPAAGLGDRGLAPGGLAPEGLDRAFGMIRGPGLGGPLSRLGRVQQSVFAIGEGRPTYQPAPSDPAGATQADALLKQTGRQAADAHDSVLQQLLALQTDVRAGGITVQASTVAPGAGQHLPHQPSGQQVPTQQHQQQGGLQPSFPAATAPPLGQARGRRRSILLEAPNSALQVMELIGGSAGPGPRSEGPRESQGNVPTSSGLDPESNGLVQLRPAGGARTRRSSIVMAPRECNASCGSGAATGAPFPLPSKYCSESATLAAAAGLLAAEGAAGGAVAPGSSMATDAEMEQLFARKPLGRSKSRRRSALLC